MADVRVVQHSLHNDGTTLAETMQDMIVPPPLLGETQQALQLIILHR